MWHDALHRVGAEIALTNKPTVGWVSIIATQDKAGIILEK